MPDPFSWTQIAIVFALAYFLGSIPFGLLLTRAAGLGDIRKVGSGNIGATNVLRTGRKGLALATLLLDGGKGALAVYLAWRFYQVEDAALLAAIGSVLGHLFPLWLKFKGGKGVATALGVLLMLSLPVGIASCLTWLLFALLFRMSSLASLMALAFAPLYALLLPGSFDGAWATGSSHFILAATLLAALIWWRHQANIGRLLRGQEPKIGRKKS